MEIKGETYYVERGLLELKHRNVVPAELPWESKVQVIVQLAVTKQAWCDVFIWSSSRASGSHRIFRVHWDDRSKHTWEK